MPGKVICNYADQCKEKLCMHQIPHENESQAQCPPYVCGKIGYMVWCEPVEEQHEQETV